MKREQYLKEKILEEGNIKDFATKINMPYTTLLSILKNVGGASIDNIFKICRGLNITAETLNNCGNMNSQKDNLNNNYEINIPDLTEAINLYKNLDEVDRSEIRGEMKGMLRADKYKSKIKGESAG